MLYPRTGKSVISSRPGQITWSVFCRFSCLIAKGRDRILSYCGPTLLIVIVVAWVCSFTVGFALLIWPALGSGIQASQGKTPTDFATALYYSGYTLTTLGVGDLVPKTNFWRLITILEAAVGFSVITASLTYLLSIYNALTRRNTFAAGLHHRSASKADAAVLLISLKGYGTFEPALQEMSTMSRDLLFLLESHHAYPILHYFRFQKSHYSLARIALIRLDLVTLVKTALHPQAYAPILQSAAVAELENGGLYMLSQLAESFLSEEQRQQPDYPKEWRLRYGKAIAHLQCHGIEIAEDIKAGADQYVELRSQ